MYHNLCYISIKKLFSSNEFLQLLALCIDNNVRLGANNARGDTNKLFHALQSYVIVLFI